MRSSVPARSCVIGESSGGREDDCVHDSFERGEGTRKTGCEEASGEKSGPPTYRAEAGRQAGAEIKHLRHRRHALTLSRSSGSGGTMSMYRRLAEINESRSTLRGFANRRHVLPQPNSFLSAQPLHPPNTKQSRQTRSVVHALSLAFPPPISIHTTTAILPPPSSLLPPSLTPL